MANTYESVTSGQSVTINAIYNDTIHYVEASTERFRLFTDDQTDEFKIVAQSSEVPTLFEEKGEICDDERLIMCRVVALNADVLGKPEFKFPDGSVWALLEMDNDEELSCTPTEDGQLNCENERTYTATYTNGDKELFLEWVVKFNSVESDANPDSETPQDANIVRLGIEEGQWRLLMEDTTYMIGYQKVLLYEILGEMEGCEELKDCEAIALNEAALEARFVTTPQGETFERAESNVETEEECDVVPGAEPECREIRHFSVTFEKGDDKIELSFQKVGGNLMALKGNLTNDRVIIFEEASSAFVGRIA